MLRTRSLFFFLLSLLFLNVTAAQPRKVIIDTDPGTDDAMAIMLALNSPEFDVRALTVVPGNVTAAQGLENAMKLVSLANRCDVAVAAGAQHPLFPKAGHRGVLARQKRPRQRRTPGQQMQTRSALGPRPDH